MYLLFLETSLDYQHLTSTVVNVQSTKRYSVFEYAAAGDNIGLLSKKPSSMEEVFSRKFTLPDLRELILDFAVIRLDQSCFAWCGVSSGVNQLPNLTSLVVAIVGGKAGPIATTVLGGQFITNGEDEASAVRIAKKSKLVMVHFSSSFGSESSQEVRMFAEQCLIEVLLSK